jgi:protein AbiQ
MELKKLSPSFYLDNPEVKEALDFNMKEGTWNADKTRGHGIVKVLMNDLTFAIPVRSNIRHDASLILEVNRHIRAVKGMGLDYSKALLIRDQEHISDDVFVLKSKSAGKKLLGKESHLEKHFTEYVGKYIKAIKDNEKNIITSREYEFTTLINYHAELGL